MTRAGWTYHHAFIGADRAAPTVQLDVDNPPDTRVVLQFDYGAQSVSISLPHAEALQDALLEALAQAKRDPFEVAS